MERPQTYNGQYLKLESAKTLTGVLPPHLREVCAVCCITNELCSWHAVNN